MHDVKNQNSFMRFWFFLITEIISFKGTLNAEAQRSTENPEQKTTETRRREECKGTGRNRNRMTPFVFFLLFASSCFKIFFKRTH